MNRSLHEVLPEAAASVIIEAIEDAERSGFSRGREIEVPLSGGPPGLSFPWPAVPCQAREKPRFLVLSRDITARKRDAQRIHRLNRLYNALSRSNQAITRIEDGTALLQEICTIAVTHADMKMAWAGLLDPMGLELRAVAWAGEGTDYLRDLHISTDPSVPRGRGPMGHALREDDPQWCQDFLSEPNLAPWHEYARLYGWQSAAALPLHREGVVIGGLALYHPEVNGFDLESQNLLIEMVRDIDLALDRISSRAVRRRLEGEVAASERKYRELTESIYDVVWTLDPESFRYLYVSPSVKRLTGYTPEEVMALPLAALMRPIAHVAWRSRSEPRWRSSRRVCAAARSFPLMRWSNPARTDPRSGRRSSPT